MRAVQYADYILSLSNSVLILPQTLSAACSATSSRLFSGKSLNPDKSTCALESIGVKSSIERFFSHDCSFVRSTFFVHSNYKVLTKGHNLYGFYHVPHSCCEGLTLLAPIVCCYCRPCDSTQQEREAFLLPCLDRAIPAISMKRRRKRRRGS